MPKTRQKIKEVVQRYKQSLAKLGIHVERVILYGSYANGRPREDSDIDLIVVSEDFKNLNLRERLEVLGVAAVRIMQPIEAQGYTLREIKRPSPLSFLADILTTGITMN